MKPNLSGRVPESWLCIDCGFNTAPKVQNRAQMEQAMANVDHALTVDRAVHQSVDGNSEVYTVRRTVWRTAGMAEFGGCLCIGCLEKRLGRKLRPKDFASNHPFASLPGTARLLSRRDGLVSVLRDG
jgi:hypothetical protein